MEGQSIRYKLDRAFEPPHLDIQPNHPAYTTQTTFFVATEV